MDISAQHRLWQTVASIPWGRVSTYGDIARLAGLPGQARWVGRALAQLPENSQLPWHRIINSQGRLSLPPNSPAYIEQIQRLQTEGVPITNGRIILKRYRWFP